MSLNIDSFIISCESMMITEEDYACEAFIDSIKKLGDKIVNKSSNSNNDRKNELSKEEIDAEREIYEKVVKFYNEEFVKVLSFRPGNNKLNSNKKHEDVSIKPWEQYRLMLVKYMNAGGKICSISKNMKSDYKDKTESIGLRMISEYRKTNLIIDSLRNSVSLNSEMAKKSKVNRQRNAEQIDSMLDRVYSIPQASKEFTSKLNSDTRVNTKFA